MICIDSVNDKVYKSVDQGTGLHFTNPLNYVARILPTNFGTGENVV